MKTIENPLKSSKEKLYRMLNYAQGEFREKELTHWIPSSQGFTKHVETILYTDKFFWCKQDNHLVHKHMQSPKPNSIDTRLFLRTFLLLSLGSCFLNSFAGSLIIILNHRMESHFGKWGNMGSMDINEYHVYHVKGPRLHMPKHA